jgi:acyl carrier protein
LTWVGAELITASVSQAAVKERIDRILVDAFELSQEQVIPSARLREDLDLDSLDGVDLVVALEKALDVRVEDGVVQKMRTVGDIHAYVLQLLGESSAR